MKCLHCNKYMKGQKRLYCNIKCRQASKEYLAERVPEKRLCKHCGKEFIKPKNLHKIFCSHTCNVKAQSKKLFVKKKKNKPFLKYRRDVLRKWIINNREHNREYMREYMRKRKEKLRLQKTI